jgi:hypothetical protein
VFRYTALVAAAAVAASCSKPETPLEKAERNYVFLQAHGTLGDLCAAAEQGKTAAADARDDLAYQTWENRYLANCRLEMR